jgi:cold shock CspA family protein
VPEFFGFYRLTDECVSNNNGRLLKLLGDGAMAVFDRAEAALQAGIQLQEELDEKRRKGSIELHCKIGIALGDAYIYELDNQPIDYLGSAVDLAARLCASANGNAILLSKSVYQDASLSAISSKAGRTLQRSTDDYFGELQTASLKGFKETISYYALFWQANQEGYATTQPIPPSPTATEEHTNVVKSTPQTGSRITGTVTRVINAGSYGFITPSDGAIVREVFFPRNNILQGKTIVEGAGVSFVLAEDEQGRLRAESVVVIGSKCRGTVARYNPEKFGFISTSSDKRDDFFVLPRDVRCELRAGDRVSFVAQQSPKGLLASDVQLQDVDQVEATAGQHCLQEGMAEEGRVDFFDSERGYGFIDCSGVRVFAHQSELAGQEDLQKGDLVRFVVMPGRDGGYSAAGVRLIESPGEARLQLVAS